VNADDFDAANNMLVAALAKMKVNLFENITFSFNSDVLFVAKHG